MPAASVPKYPGFEIHCTKIVRLSISGQHMKSAENAMPDTDTLSRWVKLMQFWHVRQWKEAGFFKDDYSCSCVTAIPDQFSTAGSCSVFRKVGTNNDSGKTEDKNKQELDWEPVKTPRIRKPPKKYSREANCHVETDARKYFHNQFYETLDTAVVQTERCGICESWFSSTLSSIVILLPNRGEDCRIQTHTSLHVACILLQVDMVKYTNSEMTGIVQLKVMYELLYD
ncbi:hypothetical protein PR048_011560 [Dryococelus australis]|uniref:Uncharacterized protein n=1 Tax=Dryococelus australis TaxID=614101 RepID=A0ABQ9HLY1_9NEOP|nr:hypothetical protein PR048_011560 [Dryococelus australis]